MRFIIRVDDDAVVDALVIGRSLFGVGKQLICRLDGIETTFCAGVCIPVRVVAHCKRAVCLLDLFGCRGRRYAKDVVWIFQRVPPVRRGFYTLLIQSLNRLNNHKASRLFVRNFALLYLIRLPLCRLYAGRVIICLWPRVAAPNKKGDAAGIPLFAVNGLLLDFGFAIQLSKKFLDGLLLQVLLQLWLELFKRW